MLHRGIMADSRTYIVPELAAPAFWHFNDVLDFIWKAPDFIEGQRELELENHRRAEGSADGDARWRLEHGKLWSVFPGLLANANTFLVASLLELHLQMILEGMSSGDGVPRQRGVRHTLELLALRGAKVESANRWPQVDALIRFRNCLMHAAGVLERSKDGEGIEQIVATRAYVAPSHRTHENGKDAIVRIVSQRVGKRLVVDNQYAWLAAAYSREFIVEICGGDPLEL